MGRNVLFLGAAVALMACADSVVLSGDDLQSKLSDAQKSHRSNCEILETGEKFSFYGRDMLTATATRNGSGMAVIIDTDGNRRLIFEAEIICGEFPK